jgi:hypothetical protein
MASGGVGLGNGVLLEWAALLRGLGERGRDLRFDDLLGEKNDARRKAYSGPFESDL